MQGLNQVSCVGVLRTMNIHCDETPCSLTALKGKLDSLLYTQADVDCMNEVAAVLAKFAQHHLRSELLAVLHDDTALSKIAARSYLHGNGFYKIVLGESPNFKLRLHVWMPGANAEENIHDHRWHLASTIVTGSLTSELWGEAVSPDARSFREYRYSARCGSLPAQKEAIGRTRLLCQRRSVRAVGEYYSMTPGTLHRIVNSGQRLTSTLMCQSAPARDWNRLLPFDEHLQPEINQDFLKVEELKAVLSGYCAYLLQQELNYV